MIAVQMGQDEVDDGRDQQGLSQVLGIPQADHGLPFLADGKDFDGSELRTVLHHIRPLSAF